MNAPNRLTMDDEAGVWTVTSPKGEVLTITFEDVLSDVAHEMGIDPGLQKAASRRTCSNCSLTTRPRSRTASSSYVASTRPTSARST